MIISTIKAAIFGLLLTASPIPTIPTTPSVSPVTAMNIGTVSSIAVTEAQNADGATPAPLSIQPVLPKTTSKIDYRYVISSDFGGSVIEYIQKYNILRQQDVRVRVDDVCISACTLITGLLRPENVCVSPTAVFGFHSAWSGMGSYSSEGTRLIWEIYPQVLRDLLKERGWDGPSPHPDLLYVRGTELYEECQ